MNENRWATNGVSLAGAVDDFRDVETIRILRFSNFEPHTIFALLLLSFLNSAFTF